MDTIDYRRLSAQDKQMLGSPHSTPVKQVSVTENSKTKKKKLEFECHTVRNW